MQKIQSSIIYVVTGIGVYTVENGKYSEKPIAKTKEDIINRIMTDNIEFVSSASRRQLSVNIENEGNITTVTVIMSYYITEIRKDRTDIYKHYIIDCGMAVPGPLRYDVTPEEDQSSIKKVVQTTDNKPVEEKKHHVISVLQDFYLDKASYDRLMSGYKTFNTTYKNLFDVMVEDHTKLTPKQWAEAREICNCKPAYVLSAVDGCVHMESSAGISGSALIL